MIVLVKMFSSHDNLNYYILFMMIEPFQVKLVVAGGQADFIYNTCGETEKNSIPTRAAIVLGRPFFSLGRLQRLEGTCSHSTLKD
jgi:hypothetical protein